MSEKTLIAVAVSMGSAVATGILVGILTLPSIGLFAFISVFSALLAIIMGA